MKIIRKMKKLIAGILIRFAEFGIILILFLPSKIWLILIGIALIIVGINFLFKC